MPKGKIDWETLTYETNTANALSEWSKKYVGTYVWLNQKHILYVKEYDGGFLRFIDSNGDTIKLKPSTENSIDVAFPTVGLFQDGNEMSCFQRIPARQYKKAPYEGNCRIFRPTAAIFMQSASNMVGFSTLIAAFKAEYVPFDAAIKGLFSKNGIISTALNSKWGLSKHPKGDQVIMWYKEYPVAEITGQVVVPKVQSFAQEIRDFVRDEKLPLEVVCLPT